MNKSSIYLHWLTLASWNPLNRDFLRSYMSKMRNPLTEKVNIVKISHTNTRFYCICIVNKVPISGSPDFYFFIVFPFDSELPNFLLNRLPSVQGTSQISSHWMVLLSFSFVRNAFCFLLNGYWDSSLIKLVAHLQYVCVCVPVCTMMLCSGVHFSFENVIINDDVRPPFHRHFASIPDNSYNMEMNSSLF